MAAADVAEALHHRRNAETKAEGDEDHVDGQGLFRSTPVDGGPQAEENKNEHSEEFCRDCFPEGLSPDPLEGHHDVLSSAHRSTLTEKKTKSASEVTTPGSVNSGEDTRPAHLFCDGEARRKGYLHTNKECFWKISIINEVAVSLATSQYIFILDSFDLILKDTTVSLESYLNCC